MHVDRDREWIAIERLVLASHDELLELPEVDSDDDVKDDIIGLFAHSSIRAWGFTVIVGMPDEIEARLVSLLQELRESRSRSTA